MAISFFDPEETLTVIPDVWVLQSHAPSHSINRAQGLAENGDEAASELYGETVSDTVVYKCFDDTGTATLTAFVAGTVSDTWHIDSLSIRYSPTDYPELSVTAHEHVHCYKDKKSHGTAHRKVQNPLSNLPLGFGCPAGLRTILGLGSSDVGIASFSYDMGITHQDEVGDDGGYLASDNRDGVETITVELIGKVDGGINIDGWDLTAKSENDSNTTAGTSSYTFTRHLSTESNADAASLSE